LLAGSPVGGPFLAIRGRLRQEGSSEGVEATSASFVSLSSRGAADDITKPGPAPSRCRPRTRREPRTGQGLQDLAVPHLTERIPAMLRFHLALLAVALAAGAAGCTQCDTCDDFPMPCAGGACGPGAYPPDAAGTYTIVAPGANAPMVLPPGVPLPPGA